MVDCFFLLFALFLIIKYNRHDDDDDDEDIHNEDTLHIRVTTYVVDKLIRMYTIL